MYLHGERDDYYDDDGNLGNWFTTLRDKVVKPVGRVVAAYYTGGASEIAFKAYEAKEAQKKQMAAIKAQEKQLAAMGNAYPPSPYPVQGSAVGLTAYQTGQPTMYPQSIPATASGYPASYQQGYAAPGYGPQVYGAQVSHAKLPEWALPVGIGAGALVLVSLLSRR